MSPWQHIYEQLSGTMSGGAALYAVLLVMVWAIWTMVFLLSKMVSRPHFWAVGVTLTVLVLSLYGFQRARHPAPIAPERLWAQPFTAEPDFLDDADCARWALEKTLETARDRIVPFQTRDMGEQFLRRELPDRSSLPIEGALAIRARYAVTGRLHFNTEDSYSLIISAYRLNWKSELEDTVRITSEGDTPAEAGRNAALKLLQSWKLKRSPHSRMEVFTPRILTSLFTADTSSVPENRIAALRGAFNTPDSSEAVLWEALADAYYGWSFPNHRSEAEYAVRRTLKLDDRNARAYYLYGRILQRIGGDKQEAIAALKLSYLYDRRDPDPVLALASLDYEDVLDLRLGGPKRMLSYALRLRPSNPRARKALFTYYKDYLMQPLSARRVVEEGLLLNPEQPQLLMLLTVICVELHDNASAEQAVKRILATDPENGFAWYNLGIVYKEEGRDDEARDAFETSLRRNGPPDAHYYLGLYYDMIGDREKALYHFRWRWAKRKMLENDFFAIASQERIRLLLTGKSRTGVTLPGWRDESADSLAAGEPLLRDGDAPVVKAGGGD